MEQGLLANGVMGLTPHLSLVSKTSGSPPNLGLLKIFLWLDDEHRQRKSRVVW